MRRPVIPMCLASGLIIVLSACGGGSEGPGPAASEWALGAVLVQVTDHDGSPVAGAVVALVRSTRDYVDRPTNAQGEALFSDTPVGQTTVRVENPGYYTPSVRTVNVAEGSQTVVAFNLEERNAATTVMLGSRVVSKGADGHTLKFEIDVGVLDESGQPLTHLADTAFRLPPIDCGWGPCVVRPTGWIDAWYDPGTGAPEAFALQPARNRSPVAVGILLDQGGAMRSSEPWRSVALGEFLGSLTGTDSVLLAEFRGTGDAFNFVPSGGFVTDGQALLPLASGLPDRVDDRESDPVRALELMLSHMEQQPATQPKALFVVTPGFSCDVPSTSQGWLLSCLRLAERSRAAAIPITETGGGADSARRTGGASFYVGFPAQIRTALRGLLSVVGGEMPFYRMRFTVTLGSSDGAEVLAEGNTFYGLLQVEISERDRLYANVVVPL